MVNFEMFLDYYNNLNLLLPDDGLFEQHVMGCWGKNKWVNEVYEYRLIITFWWGSFRAWRFAGSRYFEPSFSSSSGRCPTGSWVPRLPMSRPKSVLFIKFPGGSVRPAFPRPHQTCSLGICQRCLPTSQETWIDFPVPVGRSTVRTTRSTWAS